MTLDELLAETVDEPLCDEVDVPPTAAGSTGSTGKTNGGAGLVEIAITEELLELDAVEVDVDVEMLGAGTTIAGGAGLTEIAGATGVATFVATLIVGVSSCGAATAAAAWTSRAVIEPRVMKVAVSAAAFSLKWLFMVQIFE